MTQTAPKRPNAIVKKLSYTILATCLLMVFIYAIAPFLIEKILKQQLAQLGFESQTTVLYPTNNQFEIASLRLKNTNQKLPFNLALQDIIITYDFFKLISQQKISNIKIAKLTANLLEFKNPASSNPESTKILLESILPDQWFTQLPIQKLTIDEVAISWQVDPTFNAKVSGSLTLTPKSLFTSLNYFENQQRYASFTTQLNSDNSFDLKVLGVDKGNTSVTSPTKLSYRFKGQLALKNQSMLLDITQSINLNQLKIQSQWLKGKLTPQQAKLLASTNAKIDLQHHFNLPLKSAYYPFSLNSLKTLKNRNQFSIQLNNSSPNLLLANTKLNLGAVQLVTSGSMVWDDQQLSLLLNPDSEVKLQRLNSQLTSTNQLALKLESNLQAQWPFKKNIKWQEIEISPAKISVTALPWQTELASVSHAPLVVSFSDIDLARQQATVDYRISTLNFISKADTQNTKTTKIPFSQLNTDLAGTATLKDNFINLRVNKASKVSIKNFATSDLNTANIEVSNNNDILFKYSINDKKASLSDTDVSFNATQWESLFGSISHPQLALKFSDIDFTTHSAKLDFSLTDMTLNAKQLPFKQAKINAQGTIDLSHNKAALTIKKGLSLKLKSLALPNVRSNSLNLKTRSPIVITAPITPEKPIADLNNINIQPFKMVLNGSSVKIDQHRLSYRSLVINLKKLSLQPLAIKADTRLTRLNLQNDKLINDINISSQHSLKKNSYYTNTAITSKSLALAINTTITASQKFRKVNASWQLKPIDLTKYTQQNIKNVLPSWPDSLQITAGTYQQSGKLSKTAKKITAQVDHQLNNLFLIKDKTIISNFNSKSQSNYKDNKLSQIGSLQIDAIDNGIAITDISTKFKLYNLLQDSRALHLTDSKAQVLGATASVKKLLIPLSTPQGKATLEFKYLPLNNVLALESQPSLTGSGILQGKLPFRFSGNKFWVNQGTINSTKNGFIRYQANESIKTYAKSNSGLETALNVLDNFHYDNLSINVNYTPDGKLLLANKLSGNNPNWQQGQPIKFAINVEENVLQLLKTMQFSDQLTEKLQNKIQESTQ